MSGFYEQNTPWEATAAVGIAELLVELDEAEQAAVTMQHLHNSVPQKLCVHAKVHAPVAADFGLAVSLIVWSSKGALDCW